MKLLANHKTSFLSEQQEDCAKFMWSPLESHDLWSQFIAHIFPSRIFHAPYP